MSTGEQIPLGYNSLEFADLVDRELKGVQMSHTEREYLNAHPNMWRSALIDLKNKTQMGFTSSKARSFTLYRRYKTNQITHLEYIDKLEDEKVWRCNASRFLNQVESRLGKMKEYGRSSDTNETVSA